MEPRSLHLASHEDPAADVGRDISVRISHVSALLQQLALRGRFGAVGNRDDADAVRAQDQIASRLGPCGGCGSRPCGCDVDTREQLKEQFLDDRATHRPPADPEGSRGWLVSADALQRDALDVFDQQQRQQWADQLRSDLAASVTVADRILSDPAADSAAVLAAARVAVWDTQLAADAARHQEAVAKAAERWDDWGVTDRWAQYLPAEAVLAAATETQRQAWLDRQVGEVVPALRRGDAAAPLAGEHASLDTALRRVAAAHNVDHDERGYHRGPTRLDPDRGADQTVEADIDDRVADIAAWRQRAAAEDRDPATIPTQLDDAATAKARQTRAHTRLVDSDGDIKEAASHEAIAADPRELQPIRPIVNHLTDQPDPTPTPDLDLTDPRHRP